MLLDMGFVEDEAARQGRFPECCASPGRALPVAQLPGGELTGDALLHDRRPHLRSGNRHRAADAGQEGFLFFEIDYGDPAQRTPHPTRGR